MLAKKPKRKIAVICSSRATYGYKRRLIRLLLASKDVEAQVIVTGMHLMKRYGYSLRDIERDGFPIAAYVPMSQNIDTPLAWTRALGKEMRDLARAYQKLQPDIVLVTGDRAEMFIAAAAAAYMNIPVAHIQAGDVSGHIDGVVRHAITKLSHIHFAACQDSYDRVRKLGEETWRIFNVGAPQLDDIVREPRLSQRELENMFEFDFSKPVIVVVQHAVLTEFEDAERQMREIMEAVKKTGEQTVVIYPNSDVGGRRIIKVIEAYKHLDFVRCFATMNRKVFIGLLAHAAVLVGNSSTGILEAPTFRLAAVNLGTRQKGRMQAANVINTGYARKKIERAIRKALSDKRFGHRLRTCKNPYGTGNSSEKIVSVLRRVPINEKLLDKRIAY